MPGDADGICPNCETRRGPVGEPCPSDVCARRRYHFIPVPWHESAREFAARKHKALDPLLGRCIDRYLLVGKLGEGGMGAVYLALQQPLNREVALKVISGMDLTDTAIARFEREARAIALLDHANIRKLYDYGIGELEFRIPYMALEYVRHGRPLRKALATIETEHGGRIPFAVIHAIFRQVLNALGAAHEQGIVHRDMKPENVMIAPEHGNPYMVKILDFGLAKALSDLSGFDGEVTGSGVLLGTPAYMAPEQAPGRGTAVLDGRADLYAVAVMLFEVFTGIRPFAGDSPLAILEKKADRTFNPLDLPEARGLPSSLRAFLARGLAPDPAGRYQTAAEMLEAFEAASAGGNVDLATTIKIPISASSHDRPATPASPPAVPPRTNPMGRLPARETPADATLRTSSSRTPRLGRWIGLVSLVAVTGGVLAYLLGASGRHDAIGPAPSPVNTPPSSNPSVARTEVADGGSARDAEAAERMDVAPESGILDSGSAPANQVIEPRRFVIRTTPPGARVFVEGRVIGLSPVSYDFWSSEEGLAHKIEVRASLAAFRDARRLVPLAEAVQSGEVVLVLERLPPRTARPPTRRPHPRPRPPSNLEAPTRL